MITPSNVDEGIVLYPPTFVVIAGTLAIVVSVVMTIWSLNRLADFTAIGFIFLPAAVTMLLVLGIDAVQRRYVFTRKEVAVRRLFVWRRQTVSREVHLSSGKHGQVEIRQGKDSRPFLTVPREYNKNGSLQRRLRKLFEGGQRIEM